MKVREKIQRAQAAGIFRMKGWWVIALVTSAGLAILSPHQLGVMLAKANILALGAVLGYWVDRSAFPDLRISVHSDHASCLRRAIIIAAAMIAMALAL